MNLWELYQLWLAEQRHEKAVRKHLESIDTGSLTLIWDDWDGVSLMCPDAPTYVSELDVYVELKKRGIERIYA